MTHRIDGQRGIQRRDVLFSSVVRPCHPQEIEKTACGWHSRTADKSTSESTRLAFDAVAARWLQDIIAKRHRIKRFASFVMAATVRHVVGGLPKPCC